MKSNSSNSFSFTGRIRSIQHALDGIVVMLTGQHNAWVHTVVTVIVLICGYLFEVNTAEWSLLVLAIISVWVAEALNTAFELLCDVASPEFHPLVKKSKDVAAGAVLLSAIGAVTIGMIIFLPYIL